MKVKFISVDAQIQRQIFDFTAGNNLLLSSIFLHNALSKTLLFICTLSALKKKKKTTTRITVHTPNVYF